MSHSKRNSRGGIKKSRGSLGRLQEGVGYRTRNRNGVVSSYGSSRDVDNGTAPISQVDATGNVITAESLTPNTPITIPKPEVATVPDFVANYAGLTGGETGLSTVGNKLTVDPANTTEDPYAGLMQQFLDNTQSIEDNRTTGADVYRQVEKESGLRQYQQEANNLSGQLNTITASRDAAVLSLEGQGRGQTEGFIGGEQSRINREAAIKALPVQAQLATAQGNVALAQDHINTWGKILMDDANNEYNHKIAVNQSIFNYLTDAEKRRQDAIQKQDDRAYQEKTTNITYARNLAAQATQSGQSALAGQIMKLDSNSPTYASDIATLGGQVVDTTSALQRDSLRANIAQSNAAIRASNASSAKSEYELSQLKDPNKTTEENADLATYAAQYAETGVIPSTAVLKLSNITASDIANYAKQVPKANGAMVSSNTGVKNTKLSAAEQDDIKRLYNIKKMADELKELDKERVGGVISGTLGKIFGSNDQGAYIAKRKAIVDEIARMQTGAALTTDEQDFYNDYLPGRFSESFGIGQNSDKVIDNFIGLMDGKLKNTLANNQLSIYGYSSVSIPSLGDRTVGEVLDIGGTQYRVLPDGTLTDVI